MGGSRDNPFIQRAAVKTYNETIHPQKLAKGIMDIREQLRMEWVQDLGTVEMEDWCFWEELEDELLHASLAKEVARSEDKREQADTQRIKNDWGWNDDAVEDAATDTGEGVVSSRVSSSDTAEQFQEIDPLGGASDNLVVQVNRGNFQSSPMRGKNYDVCKKAATYIAVRQVLPRLEESRVPDKRAQGAWLRSLWDTEYCALFESDSGR
jgi:hypothetical protein